jgi:metal-responsive CopG/Arc/MetJ family transcriptional regulator
MTVKKIVGQNKRRVGRPVTVDAEERVALRLPSALLAAVDDWAKSTDGRRSEAIRRLLELGLTVAPKRRKEK